MSLRPDYTPTQLLAVAFAVMMLVSMGGVAFVGGVGAQTGGTFDQVIDEDESEGLGDDLNLNNTDGVQAVGTDSDAVDAVDPQPDGYVEVDGTAITATDEFAGIAISPERVGTLTGDSYDSSAAFSFLQDNVDTFSVNTDTANIAGADDLNAEANNAYPGILIEYAPQSEFSQIDRVEGGHDFLFLVKEGDGVAAYSVNNSDVSASGRTEVVNSTGNTTFDDTIEELAAAGLSDGNVDDVQFVAGAGLDDIHDGTTTGTETIREVQLTGPNGDFDAAGETIHSEKIALDNDGDTTYFSSIDEAEEAAQTAATITVDRGDYDSDNLTDLGTVGLTLTTTDRTDGDLGPVDRVGTAGAGYGLENPADEAKISSQLTLVQDASEVTVEGIVIQNGSDPAVDISGSGVDDFTLRNVVVDYSGGDDDTAVEFNPGDGVGRIVDSAVLANETQVDAATDTGVNLNSSNVNNNNDIEITGNLIAGFETQVDGNDNIDIVAEALEPNLFANTTIDPLAQAAVVADAEIEDGGTLQDSNIYGSISAADAVAENGSVIDVYSGVYEEDLEETVLTDNISVIGDTSATLEDADAGDNIDFDGIDTEFTLSDFTVAANDIVEINGATAAPSNAVTVTNLTFESGDGVLDVDTNGADATDVTIDGIDHNGLAASDPAVAVDENAGDVVVTDVDVSATDADASALEITNVEVDSLAVTDVSIDGTPLTSTAIEIDLDGGSTDGIDISNNTVLNGGSGTGLDLDEDAGDFDLTDNELRGGESFTGMSLTMSSTNANIDGNVITGENVADGVGIDATGETSNTLGNAIEGKQNLITGFELLIDSDMSRSSTADTITASSSSFGTYIDVFDTDNDEYPGVDNAGTAGTLYGNAATAADNVPTDANLTVTVTDTDVDTTGFEPLDGGPISVDSYDYGAGATATLPSESPGITLTGEVSTLADAPVNEEFTVELATGNEALGNHDVTDLRIENDEDDTTVITADGSGTLNAQSTFENLNVTTIGTGVEVTSQNDDVTVIEIRDSTFDVGGDGIVLADSADDRDGFVIEDVTLEGDNLTEDSDTGLDLSNVDTPGKEELPTELEVRGLEVYNFETQLKLSEELAGLERDDSPGVLDAQAVYEGDVSADGGDIVFADNTFAQAVFVNEAFEEATFDETVDNFNDVAGVERVIFTDTGLTASQERLADNQTIYGSITEADVTGVDDYDFDNATLRAVDEDGTVVDAPSDIEYTVIVEGSFEDTVAETNETTERIVSIDAGEDLELEVNTTTAIVDVRATGETDLTATERLYTEDVRVGAGETEDADELLVRGPKAGTAATDSFRGGASEEAIVVGTLGDASGDSTDAAITIDGLTTVAPHEYSVIEFQTDVDRFDVGGGTTDRGDFEAGDEFVVDETVDDGDYLLDVSPSTNLNLDENPLEAPSPRDVATFDDSRDITVNNTAFSASVTEDRVVVSGGDSPGEDIDVERQPFDPAPGEIQTSAVGINVSSADDVTIANSFAGDHTDVDTTGDSVVTSGGASATVVDSTLAPSPVDVSTIEEPTETTNTLLFNSIEGFDVDAATPPTAPVGVNAGASGDLTVSASDVTGHPGDGVLVDAAEADVVLNEETTVTDSGARGVGVASGDGLTIDNTTVSNSTDIGVAVGADVDLSITEATIEDGSATGVLLDADLDGAEISQTTIADNTAPDATADGLRLTPSVDAPNVTVRANAFENNDFGIVRVEGVDTSTEPLDATLNYFGDRNGPAAAGGDSVSENVVYDPFLPEDRTDTSPAAIESTTGFAHDVIVPATDGERSFVAVGFPAQLEGVGANGDATVDDYIDPSYEGNVFAYNKSSSKFTMVSGDTEIEAFDALVVENARTEDQDRVISLEYADDRSPNALPDNRLEYTSGLNFVAPQQAGQVDEVLFPGGDTDAVVQPFPAGENLYGATSADQVRDQFVTVDSAQEVSTNFRSGAGDATVHPHVGYFVIVNENTNDGLTVTESIPVPDSPTADEIADRTNADANSITNVNTGDTYTDIQIALEEAQDGDTLRLGPGTYESAADPALVRNDDITIAGAGATSVIDSNVTVDSDNVLFRDVTVVGELTTNGNDFRSQSVDVNANSPGDVILNGDGASLSDTSIEESLAINGENARVSNSNVGGTLSINANNTEVTDTTRGAIAVGANVDRGTLNIDPQVAFDLSDIDGDSFETGTTDNKRNVTLTVEQDLEANDDYAVQMTVTGPDGSEVDLTNDDNVSISDVSIGASEFDSQPVEVGNEFYIADDGSVETRSGSNLNTVSESGSEGIEGSITFDVNPTAVPGDYDLEMTVVQYDGQEVAEVDETGEATVEITESGSQ